MQMGVLVCGIAQSPAIAYGWVLPMYVCAVVAAITYGCGVCLYVCAGVAAVSYGWMPLMYVCAVVAAIAYRWVLSMYVCADGTPYSVLRAAVRGGFLSLRAA